VLAVHGDDGYPYAVPLNFVFDPDARTLYFHMAVEGHKLDAIRRDSKVCFTVMDDGYKVEGDWAWYVKSMVAFGKAEVIADDAARDKWLRALAAKYFPPEENVEADMARNAPRALVVAVRIEHMNGKLVHEK
jgi:nitroimidazol reductase NimA-like FMN-containing flavoprotein (pyridoxamine 5'-phosphate oxidase superfamily)